MSATASFPCDKLGDEGFRVFESIGSESQPAAPAQVKRKALIARTVLPLSSRWLTLDDAALATDRGKLPAIAFRAYRIGGTLTYCTSTRRDALFGADDRSLHFLLRCLIDADGDDRYEAFKPHGELVPYNSRTGKTGTGTGIVPQARPLPKPVALIESSAAKDPNPAFAPRIVSELRVAAVSETELVLGATTQVSMLPGGSGERFRGSQDEARITVPLTEGEHALPDGRALRLARKGKGWTAVSGRAARIADLQCGGSVVAIGDRYTIMSDGGMSVISAANLPAS